MLFRTLRSVSENGVRKSNLYSTSLGATLLLFLVGPWVLPQRVCEVMILIIVINRAWSTLVCKHVQRGLEDERTNTSLWKRLPILAQLLVIIEHWQRINITSLYHHNAYQCVQEPLERRRGDWKIQKSRMFNSVDPWRKYKIPFSILLLRYIYSMIIHQLICRTKNYRAMCLNCINAFLTCRRILLMYYIDAMPWSLR